MAHESLDSTFSFMDEAEIALATDSGSLSLVSSDECDPDALLEALESEIGDVSTGNATAARHPNIAENPTKKKQNKNRARDERRFVLIQLRNEAERLEFTLRQLQKRRSKQKAIGAPSRAQECEAPLVWQDICARQLRQRLEAERENARLRDQCTREKQLVKSIEKRLFKRRTPPAAGLEAPKQTRRTEIPAGYIAQVSAFILDELAAGVELMFQQVERLREASSSIPTVEGPLLRGGIKGKVERLVDRRVLPFSMHASGQAWWRNWHNHRGRSVQESDIVAETFGLETSDISANASVGSYGQQILRRSVEAHRIAFIWNAYIEPFVFDSEHVGGIYFLEQCHVFITPEDRNPTVERGEASSCMSACYTITPYVLDSTLQRYDSKISDLVEFFASAMFATIEARGEAIENLLFDQALQGRDLYNPQLSATSSAVA
jgi:hypothetical protein